MIGTAGKRHATRPPSRMWRPGNRRILLEPGKKTCRIPKTRISIAEVSEDGSFFITKVEGSGGVVDVHTCTEQLLYEIHDPSSYITPDVIADFSKTTFEETSKDVVQVGGATGRERPDTLKVSIGYLDCFIGEGYMSYGGPGPRESKTCRRHRSQRLELRGIAIDELKVDILSHDSIY